MNEIYGWCFGGGGWCCLRNSLNLLFYIFFVVPCWLHEYTFLYLCSTCCLIAPGAPQGNMLSSALHISCQDACLNTSGDPFGRWEVTHSPTPLCSAYTHRHCSRRPPGGGVQPPQTERTSWLWPAPALPEELRPEPLGGRGRARHTEPRTNERSAHPPRRGWLITSTHSSPLKSAVLISTANCLLLCPMAPQKTMTKSGVLDWQM